MIAPISEPNKSIDYTHKGIYQGPKGNHFTTGVEYQLIYRQDNTVSACNDTGDWYQLDGKHFHVTHNYDGDSAPVALDDRPAPADPQFDDSIPYPTAPVDYPTDSYEDAFDAVVHELATSPHDTPWTDQFGEDEPIPEGPESTTDLRKYRYTPDTY